MRPPDTHSAGDAESAGSPNRDEAKDRCLSSRAPARRFEISVANLLPDLPERIVDRDERGYIRSKNPTQVEHTGTISCARDTGFREQLAFPEGIVRIDLEAEEIITGAGGTSLQYLCDNSFDHGCPKNEGWPSRLTALSSGARG